MQFLLPVLQVLQATAAISHMPNVPALDVVADIFS
jgi:hypothetical protein